MCRSTGIHILSLLLLHPGGWSDNLQDGRVFLDSTTIRRGRTCIVLSVFLLLSQHGVSAAKTVGVAEAAVFNALRCFRSAHRRISERNKIQPPLAATSLTTPICGTFMSTLTATRRSRNLKTLARDDLYPSHCVLSFQAFRTSCAIDTSNRHSSSSLQNRRGIAWRCLGERQSLLANV